MRTLNQLISPTPVNHQAHHVMARTIRHLQDDCAIALAIVRGVLGWLSFSVVWFGFTTALRLAAVPVSVMDALHERRSRQAQQRKEHNL